MDEEDLEAPVTAAIDEQAGTLPHQVQPAPGWHDSLLFPA
jgi:hypothetical protein